MDDEQPVTVDPFMSSNINSVDNELDEDALAVIEQQSEDHKVGRLVVFQDVLRYNYMYIYIWMAHNPRYSRGCLYDMANCGMLLTKGSVKREELSSLRNIL